MSFCFHSLRFGLNITNKPEISFYLGGLNRKKLVVHTKINVWTKRKKLQNNQSRCIVWTFQDWFAMGCSVVWGGSLCNSPGLANLKPCPWNGCRQTKWAKKHYLSEAHSMKEEERLEVEGKCPFSRPWHTQQAVGQKKNHSLHVVHLRC